MIFILIDGIEVLFKILFIFFVLSIDYFSCYFLDNLPFLFFIAVHNLLEDV